MLLKPKWFSMLPPNLRPEKKQMNELEKLRTMYSIPHDALATRIISSPAITRKILNQTYDYLKIQYPELSEKELLKKVLISRTTTPPGYGIAEKEIDQAIENINSFDDLYKFIISLDEQEDAFPDPLGIGKQIDEILQQEEFEKKSPGDNLIQSLEYIYYDLRTEYPDREEHWYLANTWLKIYGSTKEAKQKGPELVKFIAYKDTHQFSILEPPNSIRGLALFLIYKELGEQEARHYGIEFSQIMEPIIRCKEKHIFLDKYKERNPRTWIENQKENPSPYSLYSLFKGLEFEEEHPEEIERLMNKNE